MWSMSSAPPTSGTELSEKLSSELRGLCASINEYRYWDEHVLHSLMWSNKSFDVGTHYVLHSLMWSNKFVG